MHTPGEAGLVGAFRDSIHENFGDHGLGCALASMQGEAEREGGREGAAGP